jgi:hypothetical protein
MRTPQEQADWELQCYGCTGEQCRAGIDQLVEFTNAGRPGPANMALGSILSDVQELIERDRKEEARQYLNRVKNAIFNAGPITLWQERE